MIDPRFFQVVNELQSSKIPERLSALLSKGDTFLDVGANHGSFSLFASRLVGPEGKVVAIEPQPRIVKALEESLTRNALSPFQVYAWALGATNENVELLVPADTSGSAGIYPAHSATHDHAVLSVPMKRCDEAVPWTKFPGRTVVKLDVEGSEFGFLMGAREIIASLKPTLIIEIHPYSLRAAGIPKEQLKGLIVELGYTQYAEFHAPNERYGIEDLNMDSVRNVVLFMS